MTAVDDLSREEVEHRFRQIENDFYRERKQEYIEEIQEREEESGAIAQQQDKEHRRLSQRDKLLEITVTPFLPGLPDDDQDNGGIIAQETDWVLRAIEPLRELDVTSADALIANPSTGGIGVIVCMPRPDPVNGALERLYSATSDIRDNIHALSDHINIQVERGRIYPILVVPKKADRRAANEVEDHEESGNDKEHVYIWRVDVTSSEKIQSITSIATRDPEECILPGKIGQMLSNEVDVTEEIHPMPDFYPSSHRRTQTVKCAKHFVIKRVNDGHPKTHFAKTELRNYFANQRNIAYNEAGQLGPDLANQLLDWWMQINMVEKLSPSRTEMNSEDVFRFNVDSQHAGNILNAVERKYRDLSIKDEISLSAKRMVLEDFSDRQSEIGEFSE